jgi:diaminopimelate epimerase
MILKTSNRGVPFAKMSGAGNDFLILDARNEDFENRIKSVFGELDRPTLAQRLCRRAHSAGADGLVFIENSAGADFKWDFYNSDGSTAEMCGNAARCVARFTYMKGITAQEMKFKTAVGLIKAKILGDGRVEVMMLPPKLIAKELPCLIDSGVPHVVVRENKINDTRKLRDTAILHRRHPKAGPKGSNITFYALTGPEKMDAISFERGVEDFTLACGTGAMAAAYAAKLESVRTRIFEIRMPGGRLEVEFSEDQAVVFLRGSANFILEGELTQEAVYEEV